MIPPPTPGLLALADQVMATIRDLDAGLIAADHACAHTAPACNPTCGPALIPGPAKHPRTVMR